MLTNRFTAFTALFFSIIAQTTTAQELSYFEGGLGFAGSSTPFGDSQTAALTLTGEYDTGPLYFAGDLIVEAIENPVIENTTTEFTLTGGYRIEPDLILLAGFDYENSDLAGEADIGYSLGLEYDLNRATFGVQSRGEIDGSSRTNLYAGYAVSEATEIGLRIQNNTLSAEPAYGVTIQHDRGPIAVSGLWLNAEDTIGFGADASYEVTDSLRVLGGALRIDSGASAIDSYRIGGGYQIIDNLWLDVTYAEVNFDDGTPNVDAIQLVAVFEMGRKTLLIDRILATQSDAQGLDLF